MMVKDLSGWRRRLVAVVAGAALALALAPVYFLPALLSFAILLLLVDDVAASANKQGVGQRHKLVAIFGVGWWFGLGFFTAGLFWIANALLVVGGPVVWFLPLAAVGLPAGLAVFAGLATVMAYIFRTPGPFRVVTFAAAWTLADWLRGNILTGFPWNLVGYSWAEFDPMVQSASVLGIYGLTAVTVLLGAMPALMVGRKFSSFGFWWPASTVFLVLAVMWGAGSARLSAAVSESTGKGENQLVSGVGLRLVQPNIPQSEKWQPGKRMAAVKEIISLSRSAIQVGGVPSAYVPQAITHVIWPESAVPYFLRQGSGDSDEVTLAEEQQRQMRFLRWLGGAAPAGGLLLTGAPRVSDAGDPARLWNSLFAIDGGGNILATYDKRHLVPFGEYLPMRDILGAIGVEKLVYGPMDFSPGTGSAVLGLPGLPAFRPLVCYEVIFPGEIAAGAVRPAWILNITNDGWYGRSPGPYQHLDSARFRAVEQGVPLVRVANTGISAMIDPYGRVVGKLDLDKRGILDVALPLPLAQATIFLRWTAWVEARVSDAARFVLPGIMVVLLLVGRFLPGSGEARSKRRL